MKRCPTCQRTFTDDALSFCLDDGTPLLDAAGGPQSFGGGTNIKPPQSHYNEPAPTIAYRPDTIHVSQPTPTWQPGPQAQQATSKRRVWPWVFGGLGVAALLGIGLIVLIVALANMDANSNNSNSNSNNSNNANNSNRIANTNNANQQNSSNLSNTTANKATSTNTAPATGDIFIKNIYMARDNNGNIGDTVASFDPSDRTVHCVVDLNKPQSGTVVKFTWYAEDAGGLKNKLIKELEYTTNAQENKVHAHLTLPRDWPTGSYRVDVSINGQKGRSIDYEVE